MSAVAHILAAIPVSPDPDEAREWAEEELSRSIYEASEPNIIDRIAGAVVDFFRSLTLSDVSTPWNPLVVVIAFAVIAALLVTGLLIWGRPRLAHRQRERSSLLFGEDDQRAASELRADAEAHAAAGRWDEAVADRFRALARGLEERDIIEPLPGTTARTLAATATEFFPAHADGLHGGERAFDDVRYLRRPG
ncbi:MAG: DUF4129 domain-containing protein, partial [Microbacterium sp.]